MNKFLRNNPFLLLTISLCIGILSAWWKIPIYITYVAAVLGLTFCITWYLLPDNFKIKLHILWDMGALFTFYSIGLFVMSHSLKKSECPFDDEKTFYSVIVDSSPIEKTKSVQITASLISRVDSCKMIPVKDKSIIVYIEKDSSAFKLKKGDILQIHASLTPPEHNNNPASFDYSKYLRYKGICATTYVNNHSWKKINHINNFSIYTYAERIRLFLLSTYKKFGIKGDEFGILAALTLGYRDAISSDLRESFSNTGAMHVLAVSGLHVGIIMTVLSLLLYPLDKSKESKHIKYVIIILLLWCYAFITGLSPSVTRATIMFSLVAIAKIFNRQSSIYNTIFFSAFCILLFKPTFLLEVGFQLSYAAVLSIVYFEPKISRLLHAENKVLKLLWNLLCVSLTAQIGTAPLTLMYFHQFPNYFLFSNFIVIPAASLIIYTAILLFCTSWIPYIGSAIAFILKYILKGLYICINFIESLPHSVSYIWLNDYETVIFYILIISFIFFIEYKNFKSIAISLVTLLCFVSIRCYTNYQTYTKQHVYIFNHNKVNVINYLSGKENYVVTSDTIIASHLAKNLWIKSNAVYPTYLPDSTMQTTTFKVNGGRYVCLSNSLPKKWLSNNPIETDYLIICGKIYVDSLLFQNIHPKKVITTKNVPIYVSNTLGTFCSIDSIHFNE